MEPLIEHVPGPLYAGPIDHVTPDPLGRGSLSAMLVSDPGPELLTLIVKPIALPTFTVDCIRRASNSQLPCDNGRESDHNVVEVFGVPTDSRVHDLIRAEVRSDVELKLT